MPTESETKPYDVDAFDLTEDEAGISLPELAGAVQVWSLLQPGPTTVREAASTFNVTIGTVRAAVGGHHWMFLAGPSDDPAKQTIEHEGEG